MMMKNKPWYLPLTLTAGFGFLVSMMVCQNPSDLGDDFKDAITPKFNADLGITYATLQVSRRGGSLINDPVTIAFEQPTSADTAMIVSMTGDKVKSATFSGGMFQFALNNNYKPTAVAPIQLEVTITCAHYQTLRMVLVFTGKAGQTFQARMTPEINADDPIENPPQGVAVETFTLAEITPASGGVMPYERTVTTTVNQFDNYQPTTETVQASLTIPQGTAFMNKAGDTLYGEVEARMAYFDASNTEAFSNLPGALFLQGAGSGDNAAMGGLPVQVTGIPGSSGTQDTGVFVSAGFVAIDMVVGNDTVKSFSKPVTVRMELNPTIINPKTGLPIAENDTIDVWSFDNNSKTWTWEGKSVITSQGGKLYGTIVATHLSYWNLDWYASRTCSLRLELYNGPANVQFYVTPTILYRGVERIYNSYPYSMTKEATYSWITFKRAPDSAEVKFAYRTSPNGAVVYTSKTYLSRCPNPVIKDTLPAGIRFLKLTVTANNAATNAVAAGTKLKCVGVVKSATGSTESTFEQESNNGVFEFSGVPENKQIAFSILYAPTGNYWQGSSKVGELAVANLNTTPPVTVLGDNRAVTINVQMPRLCSIKIPVKNGRGLSLYVTGQLIPKTGGYPKPFTKYFYLATDLDTIKIDQLPLEDSVNLTVAYYGTAMVPIQNVGVRISELFCAIGVSPVIDLKLIMCKYKIILKHSQPGTPTIPLILEAIAYPLGKPTGTEYKPSYTMLYRYNTADTVYADYLPTIWDVEFRVFGQNYSGCSFRGNVVAGTKLVSQSPCTGVPWGSVVEVPVNDDLVKVQKMVSIPFVLIVKCENSEIRPTLTFYYRLADCPNQSWRNGYLVNGKTTISLEEGKKYEFGIYDPAVGRIRSGTKTITPVSSMVDLMNDPEFSGEDIAEATKEFCNRMGGS